MLLGGMARAVGMIDQSGSRPLLSERESSVRTMWARAHVAAQACGLEKVHDGSRIQLVRFGRDVGDISEPEPTRQ